MKKVSTILFIALMVLITSVSIISIYAIKKTDKAFADSTAYVAMEKDTGRVLSGENIHAKKYMASTTKILTAITVIENASLTDVVTVTEKTVGIEGSSMYLEVGEKISVKSLLFGLMLRSGNDSAETLASFVSGSVENFAELMNKTAQKIGAKNSNFTNPHGLHDDNHYTTAYDLALISCYAMKNDDFREIVSTKKVTVEWTTRDYDRVLYNKNKMLSTYDGATGIKTGYTKKAGRCLVSSALKNGMEVITVVLNCPNMWQKSSELLDSSFKDYSLKLVASKNDFIGFLDINGEEEKCGLYIKNDIAVPIKIEEESLLKIDYEHPKSISKPFKKDTAFGKVNIYVSNNLIFSEKIYTIIGK